MFYISWDMAKDRIIRNISFDSLLGTFSKICSGRLYTILYLFVVMFIFNYHYQFG